MKCGRDVIDKFADQRVREGARRGGQAIYGSLQHQSSRGWQHWTITEPHVYQLLQRRDRPLSLSRRPKRRLLAACCTN